MDCLFTDEEYSFLLKNIDKVIEIFKDTHDEVRSEFDIYEKRYELTVALINFDKPAEEAYCYGNCITFARIMKEMFPMFSYSGNDKKSHILLEYENKHFDIRGVLENLSSSKGITTYKFIDDDLDYYDYAMNNFSKLPEDLYQKLKDKFYKNLKRYLKVPMAFRKSKKYINRH